MSETKQGLGQLSPFFEQINKYDEPKSGGDQSEEMIGKASNRVLNEKWNIKIQLGVDFFTEIFGFIKEMGYNVLLGLTSRQVKLYKISADNTHLTYITIDKTEISEYINTDHILNNDILQEKKNEEQETELLIYVDFDIVDEMYLNNKYPIDIYFDTKEKQRMYIVNSKTLESKRLDDLANNTSMISLYNTYYAKMLEFMKFEGVVKTTVAYSALNNVLQNLEKKKTKKDKSSSAVLQIRFGTSEIDFLTETSTSTSSIQMYGDDIASRASHEVWAYMNLDFFVKFKKLRLSNNVSFHVNEGKPTILETKFGAGQIRLYYIIAPREQTE